MTYRCRTTSKNPKNIILFGIVVPIMRTVPRHLDAYCTAEDEHGNLYDIYTDYDPALTSSTTIAILKGE